MKPIPFKEKNKTLLPSGEQYSENVEGVDPLHIWTDGEQCVSCWQMTWRERVAALWHGRVWIAVLSGGTQPPIYAESSRTYFRRTEDGKWGGVRTAVSRLVSYAKTAIASTAVALGEIAQRHPVAAVIRTEFGSLAH